jgi:hypothetical protein
MQYPKDELLREYPRSQVTLIVEPIINPLAVTFVPGKGGKLGQYADIATGHEEKNSV